MPRILAPISIVALLTPAFATADDALNRTYVDVRYAWTNLDDVDEDANGTAVEGSWELGPNFYVSGGYGYSRLSTSNLVTSSSTSDDALDAHTFSVGPGARYRFDEPVELFLSAGFAASDSDRDEFRAGVGVDGGLRGALVDGSIELTGGVRFVKIDGIDSETAGLVDGLWRVVPNVGVCLGTTFTKDETTVLAGLRTFLGT